jgi:hypothetical protein
LKRKFPAKDDFDEAVQFFGSAVVFGYKAGAEFALIRPAALGDLLRFEEM